MSHIIFKSLLRNGLLRIPILNSLHITLLTLLDSETLLSSSAGQTKMNPDLMLPESGNWVKMLQNGRSFHNILKLDVYFSDRWCKQTQSFILVEKEIKSSSSGNGMTWRKNLIFQNQPIQLQTGTSTQNVSWSKKTNSQIHLAYFKFSTHYLPSVKAYFIWLRWSINITQLLSSIFYHTNI